MTCTADSEYIRAISVKYRRCPSSYSVRSAVARTGFQVIPLQRPKTAVEMVPPINRPSTAKAQREKTQMLEELMFFYGRSVHQSFCFSRQSTSPERQKTQKPPQSSMGNTFITEKILLQDNNAPRLSLGSVWSNQNEALRQMYKASKCRPRYRVFPQGVLLPNRAKPTS